LKCKSRCVFLLFIGKSTEKITWKYIVLCIDLFISFSKSRRWFKSAVLNRRVAADFKRVVGFVQKQISFETEACKWRKLESPHLWVVEFFFQKYGSRSKLCWESKRWFKSYHSLRWIVWHANVTKECSTQKYLSKKFPLHYYTQLHFAYTCSTNQYVNWY